MTLDESLAYAAATPTASLWTRSLFAAALLAALCILLVWWRR